MSTPIWIPLHVTIGTELVAQRRGGTVALKTVTEVIKQVQVGTDTIAAELAITRYGKDLDVIRGRMAEWGEFEGGQTTLRGLGVCVALLGLVMILGARLFDGLFVWGGFIVTVGALITWIAHRALRTSEGNNLRLKESELLE